MRQALAVLKSLAGSDDVKAEIAKLDGVELVVTAMNKYLNNAQIAEAACRVLTSITLRNTDNCHRVVQCQGHEQIIQVMKLHPQDVGVQVETFFFTHPLVSWSFYFPLSFILSAFFSAFFIHLLHGCSLLF